MNTFALISLGILLGSLACAMMAAIATIAYISWRQREEMKLSVANLLAMQQRGNSIQQQLRLDVTSALASMDANRLHDASVAIQHGAKKLDHAVTSLNKVIFAAGMGDGMNLTGADLDEMQDVARQQVVYQDVPQQAGFAPDRTIYPGRVGYPPPGQFPTAPPADPFMRWRQEQQEKANAESGASFPAAPTGPLPDMEAAYLEDLADPAVMSDSNIGAIPGMTQPLDE